MSRSTPTAGLLAVDRLELLSTQVRITDPEGSVHRIRDFDIHLERAGPRHRLAISARPPAQWGESVRLVVAGENLADPARPAQAAVYAQGQALDAARWSRLVPGVPDDVALRAGSGDIAVWGDWRGGQLNRATVEVAATDIDLAGPDGGAWAAERLAAVADWQRTSEGWRLRTDNVELVQGERSWRAAAAEVERRGDAWYGRGERLPLGPLQAGAAALGGNSEWARTVADLEPRGWLEDFALRATSREDFRLRGAFSELGWSPAAGYPGMSGLAGKLDIAADGGVVDLAAGDVVYFQPTLFREPIRATRVDGRVHLARHSERWVVDAPRLSVHNSDITTTSRVRLDLPVAGGSPAFDIQVDFRNGDGSQASRYLPYGRMPPDLVDWLDQAIVDGRVPSGRMVLRGNADDFPYEAKPGVFEVAFDVTDATLNYVPDWPALTEVDARLRFHGTALDIVSSEAQLFGSPIDRVIARVPNLHSGNLSIAADARPYLRDLVRLTEESPLQGRLGPFFEGAETGGGRVGMDLSLAVPLGRAEQTAVDGRLEFAGNRLRQPRFGLDLGAIDGVAEFTAGTLDMAGVRAELDGQPITVDAQTTGDGTAIEARGDIDLGALLAARGFALDERLVGESPWNIELTMAGASGSGLPARTRVRAASTLAGTRVDLPAPLGKEPVAVRPFELDFSLQADQDANPLTVRYGDDFALSALATTEDGLRLRDGHIHFGAGELPASQRPGWQLRGRLSRLDLAAWWRVLQQVGAGAAEDTGAPAEAPWLPLGFDVMAEHLAWDGTALSRAELTGEYRGDGLDFALESDEIAGEVDWYAGTRRPERVRVDLERVAAGALFGDATAAAGMPIAAMPSPDDSPLDPQSLPPLDIRIATLRYENFELDDVVLVTAPGSEGLRAHRLAAGSDALRFSGQGQWLVRDGQAQTRLRLDAQATDFGTGIADLGLGNTGFVDGDGEINTEVQWAGSPWAPQLATLNGYTQIDLADGQLESIEPGPARLISLFSLQALPRHLMLDFSSVFGKGFAYDRITGRLNYTDGKAFVDRLRMDSPAGTAQVSGTIDYVARRFDQEITFRPGLNYSLPVIGAIAGGPIGGVGVFLVQQLMSGFGSGPEDLSELRYSLTGPWGAPKVERVKTERKPRADQVPDRLPPDGPPGR